MPKIQQKNVNDVAQKVYAQFESGTGFIDGINLRRDIKRCVNFESGNQWNMDDDVSDFPKITLNIIKQIGKVRKSNILQNEYGYLINSSNFESVRKIQDFLKFLSNKMNLKKKDLKVVNDTYTKGTGIMYFYWDAETRDILSKSGGKLKAEVVDIRRFRVADPYITDIQEQEYVIFVSRERINSIKSKYNKDVPADQKDYTSDTEQGVTNMDPQEDFTNVYTKFYRNREGQVYFTISTETELLKEATPLNPFYKGPMEEMPNTSSTMDEYKNEEVTTEVFNLYPFVSLVLDERDNCFYGLPGALENIEAQKSINQHFSVYDKGIQDNVLGGFIYKRGVLGDQEITTDNGQILQLDLMPGEDWRNVFGRMPTNNVPSDALNYSGNLLGVVRQVSGASNITIGQSDYSGQSGKQTEMLLQRAKENSSDIALLFNEYKREQAALMFMFAKFYYDNEDFSIIEHGFQKDNVRKYQGEDKFNGNEYIHDDVLIDIQVGPAPSFSEFSSIELLGLMVQSGQAPLEVYIANLPENYVNNKQELLDVLKQNSQRVIQDLQKQLQEAGQVMQQMNQAYQKVQKDLNNIDNVVNENMRLKSMIAELSAKSIDVVRNANEKNLDMTEDVKKLISIIQKRGLGES